jgi:hypothetical protein
MSLQFSYAADWLAASIREHTEVKRATALTGGRVAVERKKLPPITIAPVETSRISISVVEAVLGEGDATVIVLIPASSHYDWAAREAATNLGSSVQTIKELYRGLREPDPRTSVDPTVDFARRALQRHSKVERVTMICEASLRLSRSGGLDDVIVAVEYQYEFTEEAAVSALERHPDAEVILNGNPNGTATRSALSYAEQTGVPIFSATELMGAISYEGERFRRYRPPRR